MALWLIDLVKRSIIHDSDLERRVMVGVMINGIIYQFYLKMLREFIMQTWLSHGFAAQSIVWIGKEWLFLTLEDFKPNSMDLYIEVGKDIIGWMIQSFKAKFLLSRRCKLNYDARSGLCNLARENMRIFYDKGQNVCNVL